MLLILSDSKRINLAVGSLPVKAGLQCAVFVSTLKIYIVVVFTLLRDTMSVLSACLCWAGFQGKLEQHLGNAVRLKVR